MIWFLSTSSTNNITTNDIVIFNTTDTIIMNDADKIDKLHDAMRLRSSSNYNNRAYINTIKNTNSTKRKYRTNYNLLYEAKSVNFTFLNHNSNGNSNSNSNIDYEFVWSGQWDINDDVANNDKAKGVVFLAHNCNRPPIDWFPSSKYCPSCVGLPIETSITNLLVSSGYIVLSTQPLESNKKSKCWVDKDTIHAYRVLEYFYTNILSSKLPTHDNDNMNINAHIKSINNTDIYTDSNYNIKTLTVQGLLNRKSNNRKLLTTTTTTSTTTSNTVYPVHGLGFSNGGIFLTKIATFTQNRPKRRKNGENEGKNRIKFASMILMSAGLWNDGESSRYPPILFIDMARNIELTSHNHEMLLKLHKRSVICKQLVSYPRPITSTFFYEVGASSSLQWYFNKQESKFLHDNFLNEDLVWPGSYVFLDDPQIPEVHSKWKGIIQNMQIYYNKFNTNTMSAAGQLINMAWGFKELSNEYNSDIIIWLNKNY